MNQREIATHLRAIAGELKPLTESFKSGDLVWNGKEYAPTNESKEPDPHALAWRSTLIVIAGLIETQETPLGNKQIGYLNDLLFGGMGSLSDLSFDPKTLGAVANSVNRKLDERREALFAYLRK